ncbi:hypothetical protein [Novosphingobium panipatense]
MTAWALVRGAARAGVELAAAAALAMLAIPVVSFLVGSDWFDTAGLMLVDATAVALAIALMLSAHASWRRAHNGARDSVWSSSARTPQSA